MQTDINAARKLRRQLAKDDASPVELTEIILAAFDDDTPRSAAFKEAFARRVRRVQSERRDKKQEA